MATRLTLARNNPPCATLQCNKPRINLQTDEGLKMELMAPIDTTDY